MSMRYPGGVISATPPVPSGPFENDTASGVWSLESQLQFTAAGNWPTAGNVARQLWSWGRNNYGQLGRNDLVNRSSPVQVGSLTTWSHIAGGGNFTLATKTDGTLWSWGRNVSGQLGLGNTVSRSSPVQVGSLTTWNSIAAGEYFSVAIKTDGTLWSWGLNNNGQLGQNDAIFYNRSSPVQVGALTNWSKIAAGNFHSIAIKTDGTLWSWGVNGSGQLGLNDTVYRSSPVQVGALTNWSSIAAGNFHSIAIKTDGTLWSWGRNDNGRLGLNDEVNRSSPVQVGALTNWSSIAAGSLFTIAVKTDGTLWSWGRNNYGQLGLGDDTVNRSSPVQVGALNTWSKIAAGENDHALAIKTDGTLWIWGRSNFGQLGLNDTDNRSSPVQVGALTNWSSIAAGRFFTLAIKS